MKCMCCLSGSEDRKLTGLTAADKKQYLELTRLKLVQKAPKICSECKLQLQSSSDFFKMCLDSRKRIESEPKEVTKPKRARRLRKAVPEEVLDCTINEDSLPEIQSQDDDAEESLEITVEALQPEETPEDAKPANLKFLCNECGISFKTSQRLKVHSYTHSGVKSWKCSDCDKIFATKFRLKAHYSKFSLENQECWFSLSPCTFY